MRRSRLQPLQYIRLAFTVLVRQPLVLSLFAGAGALGALSLLLSGAKPGTTNWGIGILACWGLSLLVVPWVNHAIASQLWQQAHTEQKIELPAQLKAGREGFAPYARSLFIVALLAPLGLFAFGVGIIAVLSLGVWRCTLASLRLASGRNATDLSWELAGPGGMLWTVVSFLLGFILAAGTVALLHPVLGSAAALLAPPAFIMTGTLLSAPAVLDRYAAQSS